MRLTDLNSGREIGANCLLAEFGGLRLMFDCGLHPKLDGRQALPRLDRLQGGLDGVVLTHCHLDHLGALPLPLWRKGALSVGCVAGLALGVPLGTIKSRLSRALEALREAMRGWDR